MSDNIVGRKVCPVCKQQVSVVNDDGAKGHLHFNYYENHYLPDSTELCKGSEKLLRELAPASETPP